MAFRAGICPKQNGRIVHKESKTFISLFAGTCRSSLLQHFLSKSLSATRSSFPLAQAGAGEDRFCVEEGYVCAGLGTASDPSMISSANRP